MSGLSFLFLPLCMNREYAAQLGSITSQTSALLQLVSFCLSLSCSFAWCLYLVSWWASTKGRERKSSSPQPGNAKKPPRPPPSPSPLPCPLPPLALGLWPCPPPLPHPYPPALPLDPFGPGPLALFPPPTPPPPSHPPPPAPAAPPNGPAYRTSLSSCAHEGRESKWGSLVWCRAAALAYRKPWTCTSCLVSPTPSCGSRWAWRSS